MSITRAWFCEWCIDYYYVQKYAQLCPRSVSSSLWSYSSSSRHEQLHPVFCLQSFILFSNKGPKGLLQVATKYNIIQCIHSYLRVHITHNMHICIYTRYRNTVVESLLKRE